MATVGSAGVGSGLPLEELINASLNSKKAQFEKQVVTREATLKTSLSGVGKLKSSMDAFNAALQKMAKPTDFSGRKTTVAQDASNPILNMSAKDTASQGKYDIQVSQLATGSKLTSQAGTFSSSKDVVATAAGKLTFTDGTNTFDVDVQAGDTLEQLRKRINSKSDSKFGVSANIINTNGQAQLVLESSVTGSASNLQITASTPELKKFDTTDPGKKLDATQGKDAKITVDGVDMTHPSNTFEDVIQDLKFTILRASDKESDGSYKKTKLTIENNNDKAKENINAFVKAYNDLQTTLDALGKRPVIVGGTRTGDPGELAGDPTLFAVRNSIFKELSFEKPDGAVKSLFDIGIKMDKDGKLSVDSTKLDEKLKSDFDSVSALFSGDTGLAKRLDPQMKEYTKSAGLLSQRQDGINVQLKDISQKRTDFTAYMVTYEEGLRKKYASLDVMIAKMKSSSGALAGMSF